VYRLTKKEQSKHKKKSTKKPFLKKETFSTIVITAIVVLALVAAFSTITNLITNVGSNQAGSNQVDETQLSSDGKLLIIEWSDFECPFCARGANTVQQIKDTYGDQVIVQYKHFPLNFHPNAQKSAEASECARDQGKFWEYHDILFANQQSLSNSNYIKWAEQLNLNVDTFTECLNSGEKADLVSQDAAEGRAFGVTGTPGFSIGGELLSGAQPFEKFKEVIDRRLANGEIEAKTVEDDPEFTMTVIGDKTCKVCETDRVIEITKQQLFPKVKLNEIDVSSQEAQDLIVKHNIKGVPAFLFDEEAAQAANFNQISQAVDKTEDKYMIKLGSAGPFKLLADVEVTGKPMKGKESAPITIIEWSDFECPFCKKFIDETYSQLITDYVETGKAKVYFLQFPLSFHANAKNAAMASLCANDQEKFWEYHDILFETQELTVAQLKAHAVTLGLNTASFNECLDSNKYSATVDEEQALGQSAGISGTPGFLINGIQVVGAQPYEAFKQIIDAELGE
jgi:protein-disulfide isomerase